MFGTDAGSHDPPPGHPPTKYTSKNQNMMEQMPSWANAAPQSSRQACHPHNDDDDDDDNDGDDDGNDGDDDR